VGKTVEYKQVSSFENHKILLF